MNDYGRHEKNNRKILTEEERTCTEEKIRQYAEVLALEMNIRLICEMSLSDEDVLWVESICVTDISYPRSVRKSDEDEPVSIGFFKKLFHKSAAGLFSFGKWLGHYSHKLLKQQSNKTGGQYV